MPTSIYCKSCGAPTHYSLEKPNFCCACGKPLGLTHADFKPNKPTTIRSSNIEVDEPLSEDQIPLTLPSKIEYEIEMQQEKFEKLGNIVGRGKLGLAPRTISGRKISSKKIVKDMFDEIKPLRSSSKRR